MITDLTCGDSEDEITSLVGSLTVDEIALAGASYWDVYSSDELFYLYDNAKNISYWNISLNNFEGFDRASYMHYYVLISSTGVTYSNAVRPSVTLEAGAKITKGTGIINDPYIIDLNN